MTSTHTFLLYKVDGLEVGLTASMENKGGTMYLSVSESGCSVENISIVLEGGASWLYQGYLTCPLQTAKFFYG